MDVEGITDLCVDPLTFEVVVGCFKREVKGREYCRRRVRVSRLITERQHLVLLKGEDCLKCALLRAFLADK